MNKGSTLLLRLVIALIVIAVLALCIIVLPAGILSDKTGYYRPILIGMYIPAIPFFIGVIQAWRLLDNIDKNKAFSQDSVNALRKIKLSAFSISALYAAGMPYIFYAADRDDAPGVVAIGFVIIFAAFVVATSSGLFQSLLQNAVDLKSENDLTV